MVNVAPQQAPGHRLPDLVAPLLGALDRGALVGVGRQQRGLGRELLEAADDGPRAGELLAGLERQGGHRARAEAQALQGRVHRRRELDDLVWNALQLQRALHRGAWVRAVDDVELRRHGHDPMRVLLVVDVGNTQTHFGTYRDGELVEHWRFTTVRDSTADELGAVLRNLLELRGIGLADLDRLDRVEHGAPAAPRVGGDGRALSRPPRCWPSARASRPAWRCATTTRARSAPTAWSTPWPPTSGSRARCVVVDFGTAVTFDPVSADGEYLGGIISPGVEISMEALTNRAAALPTIELGAAALADRQDDGRRHPQRRDLRLRRPVDGIMRRLRAEMGAGDRDDRHGRTGRAHRPVHRGDRRHGRPPDPDRPTLVA